MLSDRINITILVAIQLIIGFAVINLFPIALDEPFSIFQAQQPIGEMLNEINKGNNSPLHFIFLHFWIKWFGIEPISVRALSLIISAVTVFVLYKFARLFWKEEYAFLLSGLFIFSRLNHLVSLEARMYGLFTLFFVLILFDFYRLIFLNKRVFIQLGLWNALLLYTHYLGGIVILMECIIFIGYFKRINKDHLWQVTGTAIIAFILFIPGLSVLFDRTNAVQEGGTWVSVPSISDLWTNLVKLLNNQFTLIAVSAIIVLLFLFARRRIVKIYSQIGYYFGAWFIGTYLLMFVISIGLQPIFFIKYLQFLTIPLIFIIVFFLQKFEFNKKWNYAKFLILVPFMLSFKPIPDVNREDDVMVADLRELRKVNQTMPVYFSPPHNLLTIAYHYDKSIFKEYDSTDLLMLGEGFIPIYNAVEIGDDLNIVGCVFLDFDAQFLYPNNGIHEYLMSRYKNHEQTIYKGDFKLNYYH